jgi:hypothetical protein
MATVNDLTIASLEGFACFQRDEDLEDRGGLGMRFDSKKNSDMLMRGYSEICRATPMARQATIETLQELGRGIPRDLALVVEGLVTILQAANELTSGVSAEEEGEAVRMVVPARAGGCYSTLPPTRVAPISNALCPPRPLNVASKQEEEEAQIGEPSSDL